MCCKRHEKSVERFDAALREWQRAFSEALAPYGMFVKTKSHWYEADKKREKIERWVVIALNPTESRMLKDEPHQLGVADKPTLDCGEPGDEGRVMHYPKMLELQSWCL